MPSISDQWKELCNLLGDMEELLPQVEKAARQVVGTLTQGNKILACGNGGSASDAMHLVEELVGRYRADRKALPAIALVADPTVMTCIANDWDFESVFSRQVEAHARPGDLLIVFSTSGNSPSVVRALEEAKSRNVNTMALLGKTGGKCLSIADFSIVVPHDNTARIQEVHTWLLHAFLEAVEEVYVEA
ncbi:MAG: SIS domain-containing protein [Verrucomicrobiota bacterium]